MKLKEFVYMLGLKPKAKVYGHKIKDFELNDYGHIQYAQWIHPAESEKKINSEVIKELQSFLSEGDFCIDIGPILVIRLYQWH